MGLNVATPLKSTGHSERSAYINNENCQIYEEEVKISKKQNLQRNFFLLFCISYDFTVHYSTVQYSTV
jgi:hypothetical protein